MFAISAVGGAQLVDAIDQCAEMGKRGNDHIDRGQEATLVQPGQRGAVELFQLFFIDRVESGEAPLRAIVELDVERKRLEQIVLNQRGYESRRALDALVERAEHAADVLEIGAA